MSIDKNSAVWYNGFFGACASAGAPRTFSSAGVWEGRLFSFNRSQEGFFDAVAVACSYLIIGGDEQSAIGSPHFIIDFSHLLYLLFF
jgi:hypothetical protein